MAAISTATNQQIESLVSQYRYSISNPVTLLTNKQTSLNARISALAEMKSKLSALNTAAKALKTSGSGSKFNVYTVDSSLSTIATGTATSSAAAGTHSLLVTQLAKTDTIISSQLSSAATTIATAQGAGTKTIQISVNGVDTSVDVTIADGESNSTVLSNLASAINGKGAGVTASVVADTSGTSRLVFTSKKTGSAQAVSLSDLSGTLLSSMGLDAGVLSGRTASTTTTGGFLFTDVTSLDSKFKLDGIDITRGTNSVNDVLSAVSFELKGVQASGDTPLSITISTDKSAIKTTIGDFITKYNDVLTYLQSKTSTNSATKTREIFASDQNIKMLRMNLRSITGGAVSSVTSGNPKILSDIGIKTASDGTLSIGDSAVLDDALATNISKVSDLFNSSSGIASQMNSLVETFTASGGQIQMAQEGTNYQLTNLTTTLARTNAQIDRKVTLFQTQYESLYAMMTRLSYQSQTISNMLTQLYG